MICNFCHKPCSMTVRDSKGTLYNMCKECKDRENEKGKKGELKYNVSVVYKEG